VLDDLDRTLRALLGAELPDLPADHVHFEPPDADFTPTEPAVNLFLYDVRENRDLRANDWQLDRPGDGTVVSRRAPRRIDCSYLITSWAGDPLSEHLLLGQVLAGLVQRSAIGGELPQGRLVGQSLPVSIVQPSVLQGIGEFWQALGNKPRAALNLTVTIEVAVGVAQTATQVREPVIRLAQKER
jgi:hypothetical protein